MNQLIKPEPDFNIPLNIVYEDKDVVVVNKQAGISVHPSINEPSGTLVNALIAKYPEIKNIGDHSSPSATNGQAIQLRPGIVHRLDKDTSGLLVVAKNQEAFDFLKKEWQEGQVKKKYLALVWGHPKERGEIISELARSFKDFRKRMVLKPRHFSENGGVKPDENDIKGKLAITEYKVIKEYEDYSLVEVYPKTGRMHQIRVQMVSIGHPVVGDKIYGKRKVLPEGLNRQFLHAYYLKFSLPNGKSLALEADLPKDLERVLTKLEK